METGLRVGLDLYRTREDQSVSVPERQCRCERKRVNRKVPWECVKWESQANH